MQAVSEQKLVMAKRQKDVFLLLAGTLLFPENFSKIGHRSDLYVSARITTYFLRVAVVSRSPLFSALRHRSFRYPDSWRTSEANVLFTLTLFLIHIIVSHGPVYLEAIDRNPTSAEPPIQLSVFRFCIVNCNVFCGFPTGS